MNAKLISIIGIVLILVALPFSSVKAQTDGFIEGQLLNGTETGGSTGQQQVILTVFQNGIESSTVKTITDEDGLFEFDNLDVASQYSYQVKTIFQSAEYYSDTVGFNEDSSNITLVLPVYDSTESDTDISIMSSHVIIYAEDGYFYITEYYLFLNDSDRTYIGSLYSDAVLMRETLRLSLPKDAENLQIEGELIDSYKQLVSGSFIDTLPIQPGTKEVSFSYTTEYVEGEYTYIQDVFYPIGNMELLISGDLSITTSEQLIRNEPFQSQGGLFQHYTATGILPGEQISLVLTESSSTGTQENLFWIIIIVVLLIVAVWLIYYLRTKKGVLSKQGDNRDDTEELLNRIAGLDDDYENGIIDENEYHELRDKYKDRLADLMENSDDE